MKTRADRIFEIIEKNGGRLAIRQIMNHLKKYDEEKNLRLKYDAIGATVRADNRIRTMQGRAPRFSTSSDGNEERGYVSIYKDVKAGKKKTEILANPQIQIPALLEEKNEKTKLELREAIKRLSWEEFEDSFLESVLEGLGFRDIQLTKMTRDGGKDAICTYQKSLFKSQALVSAKHWKTTSVGVAEVQRVRGITGDFDCAIIITSSKFTKDSIAEASKIHNQRSVLLIDMDYLVELCFQNKIGVKNLVVPELYVLDEEFFDTQMQAHA